VTAFERTHPWLRFSVDPRAAPAELWIRLGEAASKCEHLSKVPLRPDTHQKLHQLYLAKGAAATTAIEGNTLSEEQVLAAVEGKLSVPPSMQYQKQEVDNVIAACNMIGTEMTTGVAAELSVERILKYNRQILDKLPLGEGVRPGEFRRHSVGVGRYRGAPAEDCPMLVENLCRWLAGPDFHGAEGQTVVHAILQAVLAHLYLAWIHPFGDGNGRTARLVEFHLLLAQGVPSPAAHLLSNHYNQTRTEYYRQLERASTSGGDVVPFVCYAVQGFVDGLREQLEFVWGQQWDVTWRNYVHERFQNKHSPSNTRQRHLALDLGTKNDWVAVAGLPDLSPRLARGYAGKTAKTVQRDLGVLEQLGLIQREPRRVRAKREIIFALLPMQRRAETRP